MGEMMPRGGVEKVAAPSYQRCKLPGGGDRGGYHRKYGVQPERVCGVLVHPDVHCYKVVEITREDWRQVADWLLLTGQLPELDPRYRRCWDPVDVAKGVGMFHGRESWHVRQTGGTGYDYFVDQCVLRLPRDVESPYLPELPDHVVTTICRQVFDNPDQYCPPREAKLLRFAYERKNPYFHGQPEFWYDNPGLRPQVGVTVTLICGERPLQNYYRPSRARRVEQDTFRGRWGTMAIDTPEGYGDLGFIQLRRSVPSCYVPDPINIETDYTLWEPHRRSQTRIRLTKWRPNCCSLDNSNMMLATPGSA